MAEENKDRKDQKEPTTVGMLFKASTVGIHLVISTFVGFFIGYYLDKFFGTSPWLTAIFFLFGVATGFRDIFRMIQKETQEPEPKSPQTPPPPPPADKKD